MAVDFPDFIPLGGGAPPPFPVDALPGWLADLVREGANVMQVSPDIIGTMALGTASWAAAYAPKEAPMRVAWGPLEAPLSLYMVAVEEPSTNKSGAFKCAVAPMRAIERELVESTAGERAEQAAARTAAQAKVEARTADIKKEEGKGDKSDGDTLKVLEGQLAEAVEALDALPEPVVPTVMNANFTPEALNAIMAANRAVCLATSEGQQIFEALSRYSKNGGSQLEPLLNGWDAESFNVQRKSAPPVFVDRPTLAMVLAVQPVTVRRLANLPGDLEERGLIPRLLWAVPRTMAGRKRPPGQAPQGGVRDDVLAEYDRGIRELFAARAPAGPSGPRAMRFDDEACEVADRWQSAKEPRLRDGCDLSWCRSLAGKMDSHLARFAALLHLADGKGAGDPIGADVVRRAIVLADYFLDMGILAWRAMREPDDERTASAVFEFAARYAEPVAELGGRRAVSQSKLLARAKGTVKNLAGLDDALNTLAEHGYVTVRHRPHTGRPGRPQSPWIILNPEALAHR